jgi:hypothetical protein
LHGPSAVVVFCRAVALSLGAGYLFPLPPVTKRYLPYPRVTVALNGRPGQVLPAAARSGVCFSRYHPVPAVTMLNCVVLKPPPPFPTSAWQTPPPARAHTCSYPLIAARSTFLEPEFARSLRRSVLLRRGRAPLPLRCPSAPLSPCRPVALPPCSCSAALPPCRTVAL